MRYDYNGDPFLDGADSHSGSHLEAEFGQPLRSKKRLCVLVVEDDDFDFQIIKQHLLDASSYDAEVKRASSLTQAREAAKQYYDVVLVDFYLGGDIGILALEAFGGPQSDCAMILLADMVAPELQSLALKAGAVGCIDKKQLSTGLLETSLTDALYNHQLQRELQRTIVKLEQVGLAKNAFYANMSHDLKTPLNAIMGYAEIISDDCLNLSLPQQYRDYANMIRSGGLHLLEVINNLVLHSSDMAESVGGPYENADLNEILDKSVTLIRILAQNKKITLELHPSAETLQVFCQPSLITQAIVNLLSNAVKYTEPGGWIRVLGQSENDQHCVIVEDSGIGMTADDIELARKPFGRCKLSPDLSQEGTGLGLSIVEKIAARHKGRLVIKSELGVGTKITLGLPMSR